MWKKILIPLIVIIGIIGIVFWIQKRKQVVKTIAPTTASTQSTMEIDKNKNYQALLSTSVGDITIELNASATPVTVNNFVSLAKKNFYNNTIFHRVIKGFMIQGGDPKGDGTGGPGYTFADEPFQGEYTRGTVAMVNAGPNTNGSQFFINVADNNFLDTKHAVFGRVISGMDVVTAIENVRVEGQNGRPLEPIVILSVELQ